MRVVVFASVVLLLLAAGLVVGTGQWPGWPEWRALRAEGTAIAAQRTRAFRAVEAAEATQRADDDDRAGLVMERDGLRNEATAIVVTRTRIAVQVEALGTTLAEQTRVAGLPTSTPPPTETPIPSPTATPSATVTPPASATPSATATPAPSATPSRTAPSAPGTSTATAAATRTTGVATPTATATAAAGRALVGNAVGAIPAGRTGEVSVVAEGGPWQGKFVVALRNGTLQPVVVTQVIAVIADGTRSGTITTAVVVPAVIAPGEIAIAVIDATTQVGVKTAPGAVDVDYQVDSRPATAADGQIVLEAQLDVGSRLGGVRNVGEVAVDDLVLRGVCIDAGGAVVGMLTAEASGAVAPGASQAFALVITPNVTCERYVAGVAPAAAAGEP